MVELDRDALMRRTKAEILELNQATLNDLEADYERRLQAQARSVMSLMRGRTYEEEMGRLHARMVELEKRLEASRAEIRRLRGQTDSAYNYPSPGEV